MTTVYIVEQGRGYEPGQIVGVFSTFHKAAEIKKALSYFTSVIIWEAELDLVNAVTEMPQ